MRAVLLVIAMVPLLGGCTALGYYSQAVGGHLDLMHRASPIEDELKRPDTPDPLKKKLEAALHMREFASRELHLPENGSYRSYADLGRQYVVWNVFAAPEFSLQPVSSCFLFAGCVSYRGYFSEADALAESAALRAKGYDAYIGGVPAYSTLGWFNDPVLSTFINLPQGELARLIFHELTHQLLYVRNDTRFNESLAAAVEEAGMERWLAQPGNEGERIPYMRLQGIKREFIGMLLKYREKLEAYYKLDLAADEKRQGKQRVFAQMEQEYGELKRSWGGFPGYDRWFASKPNNAQLASIALYTELVPAFRAMLAREGGDLPRFYAAVKELAKLPKEERDSRLGSYFKD